MWGLCKYKGAFGEPKTGLFGLRKYRIFNIAIIDTAVTLIAVWLISYYFKYPFINLLGISFIAMIIAHRAFCVRSATDTLFFPDKKEAASKKINANYFI
jgi:hypothetical protein